MPGGLQLWLHGPFPLPIMRRRTIYFFRKLAGEEKLYFISKKDIIVLQQTGKGKSSIYGKSILRIHNPKPY